MTRIKLIGGKMDTGDACACCGKHTDDLTQDHDHLNGWNRDKICAICNRTLTETLEQNLDQYVAYLNKWKVRHSQAESIPYKSHRPINCESFRLYDDMFIEINDYINSIDLSEVIPLDELLTRRFSA